MLKTKDLYRLNERISKIEGKCEHEWEEKELYIDNKAHHKPETIIECRKCGEQKE